MKKSSLSVLKIFINLSLCLILSGFTSLIIIIVIIYSKQKGLILLQNLLQHNYIYLFKPSSASANFVFGLFKNIDHSFLFIHTIHLPHLFNSSFNITKKINMLENSLLPYMQTVCIGIKLLILKVYFLVRIIPVFLLLGTAGFIDGLTQRSIRRSLAGRESALRYHYGKSLIIFNLMFGIFIALILPIQIKNTEWFFLIIAALFFISIKTTVKNFKKYL